MSVIGASTTRSFNGPAAKLQGCMRRTVRRGRWIYCLRSVLLGAAGFVAGLFVVALMDMVFVLPSVARWVLMVGGLLAALILAAVWSARPWRDWTFERGAGEQVDRAAQCPSQPVTIGLSMNRPIDDDSLALLLLERAQANALAVAASVKPAQAYPLGMLRRDSLRVVQSLGLWLLLALIVPGQVWAIASRVWTPWFDAPAFSLTQLEPTWQPDPPRVGDDVVLSVRASGLLPQTVYWVRLDDRGRGIERFELTPGDVGGVFTYRIKSIDRPITFRLQASGRLSQRYTIDPMPQLPADAVEDEAVSSDTGDTSTTYDPDKVARRDLNAHTDWPDLRDQVQSLLRALADAKAKADSIDPADASAVRALSGELAELSAKGASLADQLGAVQGELSSQASELLSELVQALSAMQISSLPASTPGQGEAGADDASRWLKQASDSIQADQKRIGQGIGPSDLPTDEGVGSGSGEGGPDIRDPGAAGSYREVGQGGSQGPLPDAVIQQVPPSYRPFMNRYFQRLVDDSPEGGTDR